MFVLDKDQTISHNCFFFTIKTVFLVLHISRYFNILKFVLPIKRLLKFLVFNDCVDTIVIVEDQSVCVDHYSPSLPLPAILSQILKVTDTTTIRRQIESDTELP